jgi:hypothetical protein
MMPPADELDDVSSMITSGSTIGSDMLPAKAEEAETAKAAASTIFFIFKTPVNAYHRINQRSMTSPKTVPREILKAGFFGKCKYTWQKSSR